MGCFCVLVRWIFVGCGSSVVEFSIFLQDSVTPEDEETTPEEPWVVETTFGVGGWSRRYFCMDFASSVWSVSCVVTPLFLFSALLVLSAFCALLRLCFVLGTCFALFACAT